MDNSNFSDLLNSRLEAQKARNELMKWKLIVISVLGSAGLGFVENKQQFNPLLVLTIIPFACTYIDLLCRNLSIRSKRITYFLSNLSDNHTDINVRFSKFYDDLRAESGASFESYALFTSSLIISIIVIILGFILEDKNYIQIIFVASGSLCVVLNLITQTAFIYKVSNLKKYSKRSLTGDNS